MSFFKELQRRNVFRVGIAYAVAAWVLLQVVDLVLENIAAPDWVMKVFMLSIAVGFPVAVIIAWAFEMTPEGIKRESQVDRTQSIVQTTGRKLDRIIIGFLALAVIFLLVNPFGQDSETVSPQVAPTPVVSEPAAEESAPIDKSVAVLPFAFRSNNPDDEFFAEGMHDDLLTQLAKIGSLKVISRTSVMEYKDTTKKIPQIAEELGVATIVEGGVQRSGSRIRFNAQLIDAQTDEHLWAETYNRELTAENLFDIQAEIARAIAQALQATLSPEEEANIDRSGTTNLEAWESYQRAISLQQAQTIQSMKAGVTELNRALEMDPDFAAAWSLKATLLLQQYWFFDTDNATREAAWDAIQRGRSIDPTLPDLDVAEGYYYYWGYRDYEKALPFIQRAAKAQPNSSFVHQAHAYVLRRMGDWEGALAAMRRASELDPRDNRNFTDIAETLTRLRRYDEAREAFEKAEKIETDSVKSYWSFAILDLRQTGDIDNYAHLTHIVPSPNPLAQMQSWRAYLYLDNFDAALEDVTDWPERFLNSKDYRVTRQLLRGLTYWYSGDIEKARPLLLDSKQKFETLLEQDEDNYAITRSLCFITAGLGDLEGARKHCNRSLATAPKDRYLEGNFKFYAAIGLAMVGDSQAAVTILKEMLDGDAGPDMYDVIYHPAFDGIRETSAYLELLNQYGPENQSQ